MITEVEHLRAVPYFADLDQSTLEDIRRAALSRSYGRGDVVFLEGEPCLGMYVIHSGRVRIFKTSPEGREQVLAVFGPGQSFNEVPVFDGGPNPASAEALEPTELCLLRTDDVQVLLRRHPAFAAAVIRVLAARLRHLTGLVEDLSFKHVTGRIAKILIGQASSPQPGRLTQQEMAAMAGTAREVVGRALKSLEQEGIIRVERGRIVIVDRQRLEALA